MHVKKNDKVVIRSGKDRGLTGQVIAVDPKKGRVKVNRRNMMVKHRKPNRITGEEGARIEIENWIDASNVSLYSEELDGPVRTKIEWVGKNGERFASRKEAAESFEAEVPDRIDKVRVSKKTEEVFD